MLDFLTNAPVLVAGLAIFGLRLVDVGLGTMRTISIVRGRMGLAVALGFAEVSIWITALTAVVTRVTQDPFLVIAYAGGFAFGNALGMMVERLLALGTCVVRLISSGQGHDIARAIQPVGRMVTRFDGSGYDGDRSLVYAVCDRRRLGDLLGLARAADPEMFYAVERFPETSPLPPSFQPSGWRSVLKKK